MTSQWLPIIIVVQLINNIIAINKNAIRWLLKIGWYFNSQCIDNFMFH